MAELRTQKTKKEYEKFRSHSDFGKSCGMCLEKPEKDFKYWFIAPNLFPYDLVAENHDMIILKRHVDESGVSDEEWAEYKVIRESYVDKKYGFIIEVTKKTKTIPEHFHLHLINLKEQL